VGIFTLTALVLFAVFSLAVGSQSKWWQRHYTLRTSFRSVEGLMAGAPVKLAGVTVGRVGGVQFGRDPENNRVMVQLSVDRRFKERIREDSVASISTIGVVGDKYVELTVGKPQHKMLESEAFVASIDPPDLNKIVQQGDQIVASLKELASGLTEGQGLLHALVYDPRGERMLSDLAQSAADLRQTTSRLTRGEGTLGALLTDPSLYENLSNLVNGAERSWILRTMIRSGARSGDGAKTEAPGRPTAPSRVSR
jgi:phospholipid/cholesterol/gamma-HCH transport system substrate-binding protein